MSRVRECRSVGNMVNADSFIPFLIAELSRTVWRLLPFGRKAGWPSVARVQRPFNGPAGMPPAYRICRGPDRKSVV